jgi:hypothetical protein
MNKNNSKNFQEFKTCIDENKCFDLVKCKLDDYQKVVAQIIARISENGNIDDHDIKNYNKSFTSLEKVLLGDEFIKCVKDNCSTQYSNLKKGLKKLSISSKQTEKNIRIRQTGGNYSNANKFLENILAKFNGLIAKLP